MSIINLLYVLYIKLVNEISPLENNPKNVWLYYKKKRKINFFPQHFSLLTTTIILIQTKETKQKNNEM